MMVTAARLGKLVGRPRRVCTRASVSLNKRERQLDQEYLRASAQLMLPRTCTYHQGWPASELEQSNARTRSQTSAVARKRKLSFTKIIPAESSLEVDVVIILIFLED